MRLLVAAGIVAFGVAAFSEEPSAPELFKRGVDALRRAAYADAVLLFKRSLALQPKTATMCNLALTYDRWPGHLPEAVEYYRLCAENDSSDRFRDHALERARALREQIDGAAVGAPSKAVEPTPEMDGSEPGPRAPLPATRSSAISSLPTSSASSSPVVFRKDVAAVTLLGFGVAGTAAGIALAVDGAVVERGVSRLADLGEKKSQYDRATTFFAIGYAALAAGAALVIGAVVEWRIRGKRTSSIRADLSTWGRW